MRLKITRYLKRKKSSKRRGQARRSVGLEGVRYESNLERRRHSYLRLLLLAGEISELVVKPPPVPLAKGMRPYRPDFSYIDHGTQVYEDTKGDPRAKRGRWPVIKQLWPAYGPPGSHLLQVEQIGGRWVQKIVGRA